MVAAGDRIFVFGGGASEGIKFDLKRRKAPIELQGCSDLRRESLMTTSTRTKSFDVMLKFEVLFNFVLKNCTSNINRMRGMSGT